MKLNRPSNKSILALAAIAVALCALGWLLTPDLVDGAELKPGTLPTGVVVYPTDPDTYCTVLELGEPSDVLVQGPLPQFELWTPVLKDSGKLVVIVGKAGTYNVLVFPASGQPRVKGFAVALGLIKPPVPPPPPNPPPTITLTVSPLSIVLGQSAKMLWTCKNATSCTLDGQTVPCDGSQAVTPTAAGDVTYKLTATGKGGTKTQSVKLTVTAPPSPQQLCVVIVEDVTTRPADPGIVGILTGTKISDWLDVQKWTGPDGQPNFACVDQHPKFGDNVSPAKQQWITTAVAAAIAAGKPLPLIVVSGSLTDKPLAVEALQASEDAQITRLKTIAGIK